jgi:hypothetical protein
MTFPNDSARNRQLIKFHQLKFNSDGKKNYCQQTSLSNYNNGITALSKSITLDI